MQDSSHTLRQAQRMPCSHLDSSPRVPGVCRESTPASWGPGESVRPATPSSPSYALMWGSTGLQVPAFRVCLRSPSCTLGFPSFWWPGCRGALYTEVASSRRVWWAGSLAMSSIVFRGRTYAEGHIGTAVLHWVNCIWDLVGGRCRQLWCWWPEVAVRPKRWVQEAQ